MGRVVPAGAAAADPASELSNVPDIKKLAISFAFATVLLRTSNVNTNDSPVSTLAMDAARAQRLKSLVYAALSLICLAVNIADVVQYAIQYSAYSAPLSGRDVWDLPDGWDIVLTLKQRAVVASVFLIGLVFSIVLLLGGAMLQAMLAFRITRSWPTTVRVFCYVEVPYQAIRAAIRDHRGQPAEEPTNENLTTTLKLLEFGTNFLRACMALMLSYLSFLQRPWHVHAYSEGLDPVLMLSSAVLTVGMAFTAAEYLSTAKWSLWRVHKSADIPKALAGLPDTASISVKDIFTAGLGWLACGVSITSRMLFMTLLALGVRRFIIPLIMGHWIVFTGVYCLSCRQALLAMSCGTLSVAMALPFNPSTTKRSWWVSAVLTGIISSLSIALGALQVSQHTFTKTFHSIGDINNYEEFVHREHNIGLGVACLAAGELVLYVIQSVMCARGYVWDYAVEMT